LARFAVVPAALPANFSKMTRFRVDCVTKTYLLGARQRGVTWLGFLICLDGDPAS